MTPGADPANQMVAGSLNTGAEAGAPMPQLKGAPHEFKSCKEGSGQAMSTHQYRITLEYLGGGQSGPELHAPLSFRADNHDDLFDIIQRVQQADMFDADTSASLALGMKLFGEVMLKHRQDPLFAPILAAYRDYIAAFKQRVSQGPGTGRDSDGAG